MELVALQDFGHLKRGDTVDVPDDAEFAAGYFAKSEEAGGEPEVPASSTPVAEGLGEAPEEHNEEEGS